ncbi:MAG: hypothetical protein GY696_21140 [Gammaproteobacteria bacterium]|nr:hypothetical protein [Gammaproteobacteria bacterium]
MKWNERGELISATDGQIVPASNIVDLVKRAVQNVKPSGKAPTGWGDFLESIESANAPRSLAPGYQGRQGEHIGDALAGTSLATPVHQLKRLTPSAPARRSGIRPRTSTPRLAKRTRRIRPESPIGDWLHYYSAPGH